jgi:hypothetical protein
MSGEIGIEWKTNKNHYGTFPYTPEREETLTLISYRKVTEELYKKRGLRPHEFRVFEYPEYIY